MTKHFLFFFISLCLFSCSKKETLRPALYNEVDSSLLHDFYFKTGTYWIYKDSISGRTDSFVVINTRHDTITESTGPHHQDWFGRISIHVNEYDIMKPQDSINKWDWTLTKNQAYLYLTSPVWDVGNQFFNYPFINNDAGEKNADQFTVVSVNSSYSVNGQTFNNVAEIKHTGVNGNSYNYLFYVNADVGILKMRLHSLLSIPSIDSGDHVWELQRYNIVR